MGIPRGLLQATAYSKALDKCSVSLLMSIISSPPRVWEPKAEDPVLGLGGSPTLPAPQQGGPHVVMSPQGVLSTRGSHLSARGLWGLARVSSPNLPPPACPLCLANPPQPEEAGKQLVFMNRNSIRQRFLGAGRG